MRWPSGGKALARTYTPFGDLQTSTDSAGNTVTVNYNLRGHKIKQVDPDLGTWTTKATPWASWSSRLTR